MSKIEKVLLEIYRKVYAEIGVDIDKLIESGKTKEEDWFLKYELEEKLQEDILKEVLSKSELSSHDKRKVEINYWLGASPKNK